MMPLALDKLWLKARQAPGRRALPPPSSCCTCVRALSPSLLTCVTLLYEFAHGAPRVLVEPASRVSFLPRQRAQGACGLRAGPGGGARGFSSCRREAARWGCTKTKLMFRMSLNNHIGKGRDQQQREGPLLLGLVAAGPVTAGPVTAGLVCVCVCVPPGCTRAPLSCLPLQVPLVGGYCCRHWSARL